MKIESGVFLDAPTTGYRLNQSVPASFNVWLDTNVTPNLYRCESNINGVDDQSHASCSTAVQAALDSVSSGAELHYSAGTFNLDTELSYQSKNIIFTGEGAGKTVLNFTGGVNGIVISKSGTRPYFSMRDLTLQSATASTGYGVHADEAYHVSVERCLLYQWDRAVFLDDMCYMGLISNNWMLENVRNVYLDNDCNGVVVSDNNIAGTVGTSGVYITRGGDGVSRGNVVRGNWFEISGASNKAVHLSGAYRNIVIGNYFASACATGVYNDGSTSSGGQNRIIGNHFSNTGVGIQFNGANASNNIIADNDFTASVTYGVYIDSGLHNTITGNQSTGLNNILIYLKDGGYSTITGNLSNADTVGGIYLDNSDYCTVTGNHVFNTANAIREINASDYNIITGNVIKTYSAVGLGITGANTLYQTATDSDPLNVIDAA